METILLITALTALCICNVALIAGAAIVLFTVFKTVKTKDAPPSPEPLPAQTEDAAEAERRRQNYIKTEEAFQGMMNYNAYQAYGMEDAGKGE